MNISLWRENDTKKVWYEWAVKVDNNDSVNNYSSQLHNINGKNYSILL